MVEILALVLQHDEQAVLAAVELALEAGALTKTHTLNVLHRLIDGKPIDPRVVKPPNALTLISEPHANVERYHALRKVLSLAACLTYPLFAKVDVTIAARRPTAIWVRPAIGSIALSTIRRRSPPLSTPPCSTRVPCI